MSTPEIISRQLSKHHQPFSAEEPHFWMDDSDTITEFMHSLSSVFPEGEALFVRSVRAFVACEGVASNAQLLKDVKAFVSQEVQHSAEHASYNKKIEQLYHHDMSSINRFLQRIFWIIENAPFIPNKKYICLGITCSLEHLTACLAEILLTTKEGRHLLERMAPSHRILWVWHAIEETEHKAVAYDVYAAAGGWYISRVFRHVIATVVFVLVMTYINCLFLVDRGTVTFSTLVGVAKLLYFLLGYPGFFRKFAPLWCEYLSPSYHPWGHGEAGKLHREVMNQAIIDWTEEMNLMTLQLGRTSEGSIHIDYSKSAKHIGSKKSVKSD